MSQLAVEIFNENPGAFGKVYLKRTNSHHILFPIPKLLISYSIKGSCGGISILNLLDKMVLPQWTLHLLVLWDQSSLISEFRPPQFRMWFYDSLDLVIGFLQFKQCARAFLLEETISIFFSWLHDHSLKASVRLMKLTKNMCPPLNHRRWEEVDILAYGYWTRWSWCDSPN